MIGLFLMMKTSIILADYEKLRALRLLRSSFIALTTKDSLIDNVSLAKANEKIQNIKKYEQIARVVLAFIAAFTIIAGISAALIGGTSVRTVSKYYTW